MPSLDPATLFFASTIIALTSLVLSFILHLVKITFSGARVWLAGQAALTFGILGITISAFDQSYIFTALGNSLAVSSVLFFIHSIVLFRSNKKFPRILYLAIPLIFGLWLLLEPASVNTRATLFSALSATGCFVFAYLVLNKQMSPYRKSALILGIPYLLTGIVQVIRIPLSLLSSSSSSFSSDNVVFTLFVLIGMVVSFFNSFSYYLMSGVRSEYELQTLNKELEQQNASLSRLNNTNRTLLSVIAHDVRTPVASAARYINRTFIQNEIKPEERPDALLVISTSFDAMSRMLENLLAWAQSQTEEVRFSVEEVDAARAMQDALQLFVRDISTKNLSIDEHYEDTVVLADPTALSSVLRNLLSNAIKFSPPGEHVIVEITRHPVEPIVEICISDSGIGMDQDQLKRIFNLEHRYLRRGTSGEAGSGIGLALCKAFIEGMGGSITIESAIGRGTRVKAKLPAAIKEVSI